MRLKHALIILLSFSLFYRTFCKPVTAPKVKTNPDAYKFLEKFGYSKCAVSKVPGQPNDGPLCQSSFRTMIEHFQTVFRLPVTGQLDKATIRLMNKPRCSISDYAMAYSVFRPWPNTTLTWNLVNNPAQFSRDKTRFHVAEAFNDWARYAPLSFKEISLNEKADFQISFLSGDHNDGYPFDGAGGTLAHAFFPTDGRVHFDAGEAWTDKYDGTGHNMRLVAAHEIGHALGLSHSYDPKALMYPFYQLIQPDELLPKDDRDGIRALYGTSETNKPTTFAPKTTKATTSKTTTKKHKTKKPTRTTTQISTTTRRLAHPRCARYLDVVFGGGPDKWLYTLDYDLVWRYHPDYNQWDTQGLPITDVFHGSEPHMMAGILSPVTKKIYLFKGYRLWRFTGNSLDVGFPKRLFGTGTPYNPVAALYDFNDIFLLKGGLLFRFDETELHFELDKPPKRINEQYPGVPSDVRTAFTHDGKHYFFTEPDRQVYIFDTVTRRVLPGYPKPMMNGWFACQ